MLWLKRISTTIRTANRKTINPIFFAVENAAYLLYAALGSKSTSTASGETSVWEHTITRKASNPPLAMTVIYNDTQDTRKYSYAAINNLEFNVSDGLATISANFLLSRVLIKL